VARFSTTINRLVESAQPYLFPPAIKVETVNLEAAKDEDTFNFGTLFFPGLFFMAVIFGAQSLSDDFWKERLQGTLRRTVTTPQPLWVHLAGKVAAGSLLLGAVIVGGVAVGLFVFSIPLSDVPLAMVWAFLSGAGMLLFFTIIQISAASQRGGNLLSSAILFPLIMLGGSFFPFEAMPAWMARIGRLTPNGWILVRLKEIFAGTVDPGTLLISVIGLLAGSTILFLLCLARLRAFVKG
jgi:ABC-type multidrug transport system permease subunit